MTATTKPAPTGDQPLTAPPFYKGPHWFLGSAREISSRPLELFARLMPEHPDMVASHMGPSRAYFLFNADYVKHVLQTNHENYRRPRLFSRLLHTVADENLFSSEGAYWKRQRKLLSPAFHRQQIVNFSRIMGEEALHLLGRWSRHPAGTILDIQQEMTDLTLNIVGRSLFSVDMLASTRGQELTRGFAGTTGWLNYRFSQPFAPPVFVPIKPNRDFLRARQIVRKVSREILEERRAAGGEHHDFLQMLLDLRYEDTGEGMNDMQIINEMGTFFFAGHETTANTLTWTWYLLDQNPAVEARLHEELDRVLDGRAPTVEDLPHLPYNRMVIQESMRLYPAAWATSREPIDDDQVGPYRLVKGAVVFAAIAAVHRNPAYWEDPETFEPERFSDERSKERPNHAYIPFGIGPRFCIGSQFGMTEAQLVLATLAQKIRPRLLPGAVVEPETVFTLRVKDQLPMTIEYR